MINKMISDIQEFQKILVLENHPDNKETRMRILQLQNEIKDYKI